MGFIVSLAAIIIVAYAVVFIVAMIAHGYAYTRHMRCDDIREFRQSTAYKAITDEDERREALSEFCHRATDRYWSK